MAIFIGGNSTELEYNFSNKVSGSTKECPMKIYSNSVDIKNLPKPTDSNWKEITNQNFIDKLKTQDSDTVVEITKNEVLGNIINTNTPCDGVMNVEIGGNTMYKTSSGKYTDIWESGCTLESVGENENKIEILSKKADGTIGDKIYISNILRGLPNEIRDVASGDIITRKVGKIVLDGSENWVLQLTNMNTLRFQLSNLDIKSGYLKVISDKFNQTNETIFSNVGYECISSHPIGGEINIWINKSKLDTLDVTGFKKWLQLNPTTVYYELKTPVIEKMQQTLTLQSFENGSLVINTSIPPFIKEWHSINKDDNGIMQYQSGTSGLNQALLVELDLNGLCDSFYNSDNNLLKNNLKELSMNAWMYGEGNNNGLVDYLCKIYYFQNNMWESRNKNNTNIPQKISEEKTKQDFPNLQITDDNKIYMLLLSNYPANDDIPSRLFLDYVDLRLKIDRQADIIQSTDISLNDEWSIFIKGFSPSWSSDNALIQNHTIFELKDKLILAYNRDEKVFYFEDLQAKIITKLPQFSFKSFQSINFIITQNRNRKITLYALPNDGEIQKMSSIGHNINEMCPIYLCQNSSNTNQSDAFIEDIQILHQTFVDKEIEVILKGRNEIDKDDDYYNKLAEIYKNPNIIPDFKNDKWSIHSNANVSDDGKTLTLNAVDKWETSFIKIPVLPNNRYILKANVSESDKYAYISFKQQHNDSVPLWSGDIGISKNENLFTTSYDCNNITIFCGSSQAGIFKFSDLELKRLD